MVHFPGFARARLWIQRAVRRFCRRGFPHSEIPGSKPACGSPRLIAACHVLHRLLLPRHPPCALSSLTIKFTQPFSCLPEKTEINSMTLTGPAHRGPATRLELRPPQQISKALIKNYSALYLPNLFSCQISSLHRRLGGYELPSHPELKRPLRRWLLNIQDQYSVPSFQYQVNDSQHQAACIRQICYILRHSSLLPCSNSVLSTRY